ncbi:MAG: DUF364 domain-containing protein [Anaerolineae bacterium]|nr:DUF364 domain-containing protein [Anaerolineae bacterium]
MTVLEALITDLPEGWRVTDIYVGANWVLSLVSQADGTQQAGVASTPKQIAPDSRFQIGHYQLNENAGMVAQFSDSSDMTTAAVGLATINALNRIDQYTTDDAADWLSAQCADRNIAIFGRFPFINDELRPFARQVWVFEQQPQAGELDETAIKTILPQADLVAITGSSVINHSIDLILPHAQPGSTIVLLGPSTPLSPKLFDCGIDVLFGVRVVDVQRVIDSVIAGEGFQKMEGLHRVALFKQPR